MRTRGLLVACALTLAAPPAAAQSSDAGATADITGAWSFETDVYPLGCQMTGELTLHPTTDPDVFDGRLMAYESCEGGARYEAKQISTARRDGAQLVIESALVRVLPSPEFYQPDDFELTIVDGALMVGELRSADIAGVRFFRRDGPIA